VEPEDRPKFPRQPSQILHRRGRIQRQHVADHRFGRWMWNRTQSVPVGRCRREIVPCVSTSTTVDDAYPNRLLRHSISLALTSSGFSCCVQWPLSRTRYFSRSGTNFSMPSAADGGSTASFSAMIISDGTRTVWSSPSERCQLRVKLRYQLMPPVKPVFVKVSTNTFFSSADRIGVRGSCLASSP